MLRSILEHKKIALVVAIGAILLFFGFGEVTAAAASGSQGYTTPEFNVTAVADEDHVFHITEEITVDFQTPHHGIYRNIPQRSGVYRIDNEKVPGDDWEESVEDSSNSGTTFLSLRIGDADDTIIGKKKYEISYDIVCAKDNNKNADYLSLDLLPSDWESPIASARLSLSMPNGVDRSAYQFFYGAYGSKNDGSEFVTISKDGRKISAELSDIPERNAFTVAARLPEGYWKGAEDRSWAAKPAMGILGSALLIIIALWLKFGRNGSVTPVVEFYPPEGMTPAELGYLADGMVDNDDMGAMMMYMASKGYLKIIAEGDSAMVEKVQEPGDDIPSFVKTLYDGLFEDSDRVDTHELPESFDEYYSAAKLQVRTSSRIRFGAMYSPASRAASFVAHALIFLECLLSVLLFGYAGYSAHPDENLIVGMIGGLITLGGMVFMSIYRAKKRTSKKSSIMVYLILGMIMAAIGMLITALFAGSYAAFAGTMGGSVVAQSAFIFIVLALSVIFAIRVKSRSPESMLLWGRIIGFRNFIRDAEYDRLKVLSDENPEYFFDILPYAHVLGMATKWSEKFADIDVPIPDWYSGVDQSTVMNTLYYGSMMKDISTNFLSSVSTMSDSGGGGFSGGSFSGGGFGGGGGGAW
ncbi:MAG: DUF2207 domain-containing protein [Eubacteriales bacterium]|nr:DUF2207 domain-containing protein [Eubacteriales bacterium]